MRVDIFTIFPEFFASPLQCSILKRAVEGDALQVAVHNVRDYTQDKHHVVDDYPYGGGAGMVMKPQPFFDAVEGVLGFRAGEQSAPCPIVLFSPQGRVFNTALAQELAQRPRLALLCGHYEGVDERVRQHLATEEISVGDYVLTGGEPAALVVLDAVARWIPNVLGDAESARTDSFSAGLLEHPHYTRPAEYRGWEVPEVLLSGHHGAIARWRRKESLRRTRARRPDLLRQLSLSQQDQQLLAEIEEEEMGDERCDSQGGAGEASQGERRP